MNETQPLSVADFTDSDLETLDVTEVMDVADATALSSLGASDSPHWWCCSSSSSSSCC